MLLDVTHDFLQTQLMLQESLKNLKNKKKFLPSGLIEVFSIIYKLLLRERQQVLDKYNM